MKNLLISLLVLLSYMARADFSIKQIDPFSKVLSGVDYPATTIIQPASYGDHITVQLLLRSDNNEDFSLAFTSSSLVKSDLEKIVQYRVGYVKAQPVIMGPSKNQLKSVTGAFPDPLFRENDFTVSTGHPLSIVLDIPIQQGFKPGLHLITVRAISSASGKVLGSAIVRFQVYPVVIPAKEMDYVNWYHDVDYNILNNGKEVPAFSSQYWTIFKNIVISMKGLGQNTFTINPTYLITFKKTATGWVADYTNFDRAVTIILNTGMKYVECRQFSSRQGGWESAFGWLFPRFYSATQYMMDIRKFDDQEANDFYKWFVRSYYRHLQQQRWLSKILQHVADEPIPENADSYIQFNSFIKKIAPGLKIIEATATMKVQANVDFLVIPLGNLQGMLKEIKQLQKATKKKFWLYTSIHPQGEYANRFIELPLIKTTLLPWIAAKYEMDGYLHWGLNFWGNKPCEDASNIQFVETYKLPAGDAYLVYPGDQNINPSLRALAMRNGLYDVELLQSLKKRRPAKAAEINNLLIRSFDDYELSTKVYFEQKHKILQLLSSK